MYPSPFKVFEEDLYTPPTHTHYPELNFMEKNRLPPHTSPHLSSSTSHSITNQPKTGTSGGLEIPKLEKKLLTAEKNTCSRSWCNNRGYKFNEDSNQWYNLNTNRFIKNQPKDNTTVYSLRGIRIIGNMEQIKSFITANDKNLIEVYGNNRNFNNLIYRPYEDIKFIATDAAERSKASFIAYPDKTTCPVQNDRVEDLTNQQIEQLCAFNFGGLFLKCRVLEVIDGDTMHVAAFIPLYNLGSIRSGGKKNNQKSCILPIGDYQTTGFFTRIKIRMYGYDSAEKDTDGGKIAKNLLVEKVTQLKNIVWCQFIEINIAQEKYDRTLAVIYEDEKRTLLLNDYLQQKQTEMSIKIVNPYMGGTKVKF